ncbi:hypothetical protein GCM10025866_21250 [Naasia aerilata]|uniref:Uncharacterized protein n=1 Tax=Naasia aerilata TaxID=1162966 RepID=A0ABM8GDA2_9MICO|nr:hypothetical protein GCM10025866_21250 [Naasia aerilata]
MHERGESDRRTEAAGERRTARCAGASDGAAVRDAESEWPQPARTSHTPNRNSFVHRPALAGLDIGNVCRSMGTVNGLPTILARISPRYA